MNTESDTDSEPAAVTRAVTPPPRQDLKRKRRDKYPLPVAGSGSEDEGSDDELQRTSELTGAQEGGEHEETQEDEGDVADQMEIDSPFHPSPSAFNNYCNEFLKHTSHLPTSLATFSPHLSSSPVPPSQSVWTAKEKHLFFHLLSRHSRLRPDLIALDLKASGDSTKSEAEIKWYIDVLEVMAEMVDCTGPVRRRARGPWAGWRRGLAPAAMEVGPREVLWEEGLAKALTNKLEREEAERKAAEGGAKLAADLEVLGDGQALKKKKGQKKEFKADGIPIRQRDRRAHVLYDRQQQAQEILKANRMQHHQQFFTNLDEKRLDYLSEILLSDEDPTLLDPLLIKLPHSNPNPNILDSSPPPRLPKATLLALSAHLSQAEDRFQAIKAIKTSDRTREEEVEMVEMGYGLRRGRKVRGEVEEMLRGLEQDAGEGGGDVDGDEDRAEAVPMAADHVNAEATNLASESPQQHLTSIPIQPLPSLLFPKPLASRQFLTRLLTRTRKRLNFESGKLRRYYKIMGGNRPQRMLKLARASERKRRMMGEWEGEVREGVVGGMGVEVFNLGWWGKRLTQNESEDQPSSIALPVLHLLRAHLDVFLRHLMLQVITTSETTAAIRTAIPEEIRLSVGRTEVEKALDQVGLPPLLGSTVKQQKRQARTSYVDPFPIRHLAATIPTGESAGGLRVPIEPVPNVAQGIIDPSFGRAVIPDEKMKVKVNGLDEEEEWDLGMEVESSSGDEREERLEELQERLDGSRDGEYIERIRRRYGGGEGEEGDGEEDEIPGEGFDWSLFEREDKKPVAERDDSPVKRLEKEYNDLLYDHLRRTRIKRRRLMDPTSFPTHATGPRRKATKQKIKSEAFIDDGSASEGEEDSDDDVAEAKQTEKHDEAMDGEEADASSSDGSDSDDDADKDLLRYAGLQRMSSSDSESDEDIPAVTAAGRESAPVSNGFAGLGNGHDPMPFSDDDGFTNDDDGDDGDDDDGGWLPSGPNHRVYDSDPDKTDSE